MDLIAKTICSQIKYHGLIQSAEIAMLVCATNHTYGYPCLTRWRDSLSYGAFISPGEVGELENNTFFTTTESR